MDQKIKIQSASSIAGKETIYVDVDDEITGIIDKVAGAKGKVIALVLPKRCAVLQSIVNMKLLKRTAEQAGKNLVLITTDAGLLPLAGTVGLFVASTPTSKPAIPATPAAVSDEPEDVDEPLDIVDGTADDFDKKAAAGTPIGVLASPAAAAADDEIDESLDMGDDSAAPAAVAPVASKKPQKNRSLKVPNFDSFRKKLLLGIAALVVLIAAWIVAVVVLPKATITIKTDSSTIPTNVNLVLDSKTTSLDTSSGTVPATIQSQQKTNTQQVPATGQQNNGDKATGSVTFTVQECGSGKPSTISAGSSVKSDAGQTYILTSSAAFGPPTAAYPCWNFSSTASIAALNPGAAYNTDGTTGFTASNGTKGSGSADGGTDNIVKIVSQSDIDGATKQITTSDSGSVKQQLVSNIESQGLMPITSTFATGTPQVTTSAKAGDQADNVTVTAVTTYTMFAVKKSDIQQLVEANVKPQLDKGKQVILDNGVANADFTPTSPTTGTSVNVAMHVKSEVGPHIDTASLKTTLAGKKAGDVKSYLKQTPGVTDVDVHFSPFWVNTVPGKASKVTVQIAKASS